MVCYVTLFRDTLFLFLGYALINMDIKLYWNSFLFLLWIFFMKDKKNRIMFGRLTLKNFI